jgi:hypothetical protein
VRGVWRRLTSRVVDRKAKARHEEEQMGGGAGFFESEPLMVRVESA